MKKVIILLSLFLVPIILWAGTITETVHFGDGLTSVTIKTYQDVNGTFTLSDSSVVSVFPNDTTIGYNSSSAWVFLYGYLYDNETDTLWGWEHRPKPHEPVSAFKDTIVALDTSGADAVIEDAYIVVTNNSTSMITDAHQTNANGKWIFSLDSGITYDVYGNLLGYVFPDTQFTVAGNQTDTIMGYNVTYTGSIPSNDNLCAVNGAVYDTRNNIVPYAVLWFSLNEQVYNSCDNVLLAKTTQRVECGSDGTFNVQLLKNSCMSPVVGDTVYYKVEVEGDQISREHTFYIPSDSTSYLLVF